MGSSLRYVWNVCSTVRYPFLCPLTCTLAKEVQLFPGLGLYSGIFALYLQRPLNECRTATIIFYALCLIYVLSTVNVVADFLSIILKYVSNNSISKNIIFLSVVQTYFTTLSLIDGVSLEFSLGIIGTIASGCCDFLAQCILVRINH
jgi:hypothetical protein